MGEGIHMDEIRIKVNTALLEEKAGNAEKKINLVRNKFANIEQSVRQSVSYWEGDANEAHRREYEEYKEEIETALARFQENVDDLRRIAGVYDKAAADAENLSGDLPVDVIL